MIKAVDAVAIATGIVMRNLDCPNSGARYDLFRSKQALHMMVSQSKKVKLALQDGQVAVEIFGQRGDGWACLKYNNIQKDEETSKSNFVQVW